MVDPLLKSTKKEGTRVQRAAVIEGRTRFTLSAIFQPLRYIHVTSAIENTAATNENNSEVAVAKVPRNLRGSKVPSAT